MPMPPDLRSDALTIARAGIAAADPGTAVARWFATHGPTLPTESVLLLAVGKAAHPMAAAALEGLAGRRVRGAITGPLGATAPASSLTRWTAGHPVPDIGGFAAAADALAMARGAGEGDLVLCLLSGGASALWSAPAPGLTLDHLRAATEALLRSGAPIEAVNTVRRHLSAISGGRLAAAARPASVLTLAISDVIGGGPGDIGSGPTLPDPTTYQDALDAVRDYSVDLPAPVLEHLRAGARGEIAETPSEDALDNLLGFQIVLSIDDALSAAAAEAERLGYAPRIVTAALQGEAREAGAELARAALASRPADDRPRALLWGGETTVTVRGAGRGGRNQELALAAAGVLRGVEGVVLASLGTDGRDGPTDAAGAVVDGATLSRGEVAGLDAAAHLRANDSYAYLRATGDLLVIGPTGTNVNDLAIALINPSPAAG